MKTPANKSIWEYYDVPFYLYEDTRGGKLHVMQRSLGNSWLSPAGPGGRQVVFAAVSADVVPAKHKLQ